MPPVRPPLEYTHVAFAEAHGIASTEGFAVEPNLNNNSSIHAAPAFRTSSAAGRIPTGELAHNQLFWISL